MRERRPAGGGGRWERGGWGPAPLLSPAEKASTIEARYHKLKEKHSELIGTHAELLRKVGGGAGEAGHGQGCVRPGAAGAGVCPLPVQNADTAKQLTVTQQSQEEVARVKEQLAFQMEQVKRESEMKVRPWAPGAPPPCPCPPPPPPVTRCPVPAGGAE